MPTITSDLSINIIHTLYLLFAHNYIVFTYFTGLLISIFLSIKSPSRYSIFLFLGFAFLTFSFEYDKHIAENLRQQTLQSLITEKPHYTAQKYIDSLIGEILPIFLYTTGWICIFTSLFLGSKKIK